MNNVNEPDSRADALSPSNGPTASGSRSLLAGDEHVHPRSSRLWLWVFAAFALQLVAWTTWLVIASQHRVPEVPLAGAASDTP